MLQLFVTWVLRCAVHTYNRFGQPCTRNSTWTTLGITGLETHDLWKSVYHILNFLLPTLMFHGNRVLIMPLVKLKHYNCVKNAVTTVKSSHASLRVQLPNICFVIQNRLIVKSFQKTFQHFLLFLVARE